MLLFCFCCLLFVVCCLLFVVCCWLLWKYLFICCCAIFVGSSYTLDRQRQCKRHSVSLPFFSLFFSRFCFFLASGIPLCLIYSCLPSLHIFPLSCFMLAHLDIVGSIIPPTIRTAEGMCSSSLVFSVALLLGPWACCECVLVFQALGALRRHPGVFSHTFGYSGRYSGGTQTVIASCEHKCPQSLYDLFFFFSGVVHASALFPHFLSVFWLC